MKTVGRVLLAVITFVHGANCQKELYRQLISSTVSIDFPLSDEDGSGLFYRDSNFFYLISAKHNFYEKNITSGSYVLKQSSCILTLHHTSPDSGLLKRELYLDLALTETANKIRFLHDRDLVAIQIGTSVGLDSTDSLTSFYSWLKEVAQSTHHGKIFHPTSDFILDFTQVYEGEEICLLGYPKAIVLGNHPQFDSSRPLLRKGIVAGINTKNNTVIIDAASFGGNSGGPVILFNNSGFYLLGIVIEYIPISPSGRYVGNSGYTVVEPASSINSLIKMFY